jgi:hypothetical protein
MCVSQEMRIHCDLFWTRKVLGYLIRNADLYSSSGEPITITTKEKDGFIFFISRTRDRELKRWNSIKFSSSLVAAMV